MTTPDNIRVYWDKNSEPEGWAYNAWRGGPVENGFARIIESGPLEINLATDAGSTELAEAVVWLGKTYGLDIDQGSVCVDDIEEGGWASWSADDDE